MRALRDRLEAGVMAVTPNAIIVGRDAPRIANTSCIALPGKPAETMVIRLDLEGIAISAGAACTSGKVGANSVLEAMGLGADIARSAVRISLGPQTREDDIAAFLAAWEKIAGRAALAA
jgi:cysteine desulfurase